jgi:hypothetical protein
MANNIFMNQPSSLGHSHYLQNMTSNAQSKFTSSGVQGHNISIENPRFPLQGSQTEMSNYSKKANLRKGGIVVEKRRSTLTKLNNAKTHRFTSRISADIINNSQVNAAGFLKSGSAVSLCKSSVQ